MDGVNIMREGIILNEFTPVQEYVDNTINFLESYDSEYEDACEIVKNQPVLLICTGSLYIARDIHFYNR